MRALVFLAAFTLTAPHLAHAQWQLQPTPTTADLRGIDNVGNGIAWASGSNGTILHTTDSGLHWQRCTTPPNAASLDFRGIQAFDATTAIAMSSGPSDQSRLYKTTDACQSWTLLFTNPDKTGFFDAIIFYKGDDFLLGDPVDGSFQVASVNTSGTLPSLSDSLPANWRTRNLRLNKELQASGRGAFAASNSSLAVNQNRVPHNACQHPEMWFGTSGPNGAKVFRFIYDFRPACYDAASANWHSTNVPMAGSNASSGVFSLGAEDDYRVVAVGGDYLKPKRRKGTAAYSEDGGETWAVPTHFPHGYRSAAAYDAATNTWITVGPNGTDISTDDGRNWHALKPNPADPAQPPDADEHWNALSLPFVVGPHGRIGILSLTALKP